jgi:hypothetical protein
MKKRSFLLFELLISLALISLCLFPLIQPHAAMRKKEKCYLEEIQLERIAQNAFCILKQKLYENSEHAWDDLVKGTAGMLEESFQIINGRESGKTYSCSYTIECIGSAPKPSFNKEGAVIVITLSFVAPQSDPSIFQRTLYLERVEASLERVEAA